MTRITKDFFEEVYYKSIETEYTKLFENGYYNRLKECTSEDLYGKNRDRPRFCVFYKKNHIFSYKIAQLIPYYI